MNVFKPLDRFRVDGRPELGVGEVVKVDVFINYYFARWPDFEPAWVNGYDMLDTLDPLAEPAGFMEGLQPAMFPSVPIPKFSARDKVKLTTRLGSTTDRTWEVVSAMYYGNEFMYFVQGDSGSPIMIQEGSMVLAKQPELEREWKKKMTASPPPPKPKPMHHHSYVDLSSTASNYGPTTESTMSEFLQAELRKEIFNKVDRGSLLRIASATEKMVDLLDRLVNKMSSLDKRVQHLEDNMMVALQPAMTIGLQRQDQRHRAAKDKFEVLLREVTPQGGKCPEPMEKELWRLFCDHQFVSRFLLGEHVVNGEIVNWDWALDAMNELPLPSASSKLGRAFAAWRKPKPAKEKPHVDPIPPVEPG